ncbi:Ig-like domain-containing protein [Peribacillus asahii]|uniref:Ig-like domain-containing protein n=1 Tax=Peribacillus asahii TaxID=228899 RepID=UPI00382496D7
MGFKTVDIKVSEVRDTNPNTYVKRAEDRLKRNQYNDALKEMDQAIEYAPANNKVKYAFEKIKIFEAVGNRVESTNFIKKYLKRFYSELPLSDFYRVLRVLKNNNASTSILDQNGIPSVLMQLCQTGRESESFFKEKAQEYMKKGNYTDALSCTRLIKEKFGEDSDLSLLNAQIYSAQGSYSTALSHYSIASNLPHPKLSVFTEAAGLHIRINKVNEAQNWINKGLSAYPFNSELLHLKADLFYKDSKYEQCLEVLDTIIEKSPQDAKAYYTKGLIYDHQKRFSLANRYFKKAEAINQSFKAPANQEREQFLNRMKALVITLSTAVVLLIMGQFVLFKTGMVKPIVYGTSAIVADDVLISGDTMQVYDDYNYFPAYAKEPDIKYRITNPLIAQVNSAGEIKGLKEGTTSIQLINGEKVLDSFEFQVVIPEVSSIKIDLSGAHLEVGETGNVYTTVKMNFEDAEFPNPTFTSSNPAIIMVDEDGVLKALKPGNAQITASAGDKKASVIVHSYAKVEEILLAEDENGALRLRIGKTLTLEPTVKTTPENGEYYPLSYDSSDTSIATVNRSGEVTGVSEGEVEIIISSLNGIEKRVPILVTDEIILKQPSNLQVEYDENSQSIKLSWSYDSGFNEEEGIGFNISAALNGGMYQLLKTTTETGLVLADPERGAKYSFKIEAVLEEVTGDPATVSVDIPKEEDYESVTLDSNNDESNEEIEEIKENSNVAKTADEIEKDKEVENMVSYMSSLVGYWKNVSPDDSDTYDLKYAVVGNDSSDSRQNSYKASYLNKSYYFTLTSSFWEYGLREDWIKIEGNKLYDSEGDAIIVHNSNKFTLEFKDGYRGEPNKTFTFVRVNKADIPSEYLSNSSVKLP